MRPLRVLETCVYATDLEAAERFYAGVLGLEPFAREPGRYVFFRCGPGVFLVFNPERTGEPQGPGRIPPHGARGASHTAFAIGDEESAAWRERLDRLGVDIEAEVEWPSGGCSLYLRDPAGNSIELASPRIWGSPG